MAIVTFGDFGAKRNIETTDGANEGLHFFYETDKFTKRKHVFENKQDCLDSVNYIQTNPKN